MNILFCQDLLPPVTTCIYTGVWQIPVQTLAQGWASPKWKKSPPPCIATPYPPPPFSPEPYGLLLYLPPSGPIDPHISFFLSKFTLFGEGGWDKEIKKKTVLIFGWYHSPPTLLDSGKNFPSHHNWTSPYKEIKCSHFVYWNVWALCTLHSSFVYGPKIFALTSSSRSDNVTVSVCLLVHLSVLHYLWLLNQHWFQAWNIG